MTTTQYRYDVSGGYCIRGMSRVMQALAGYTSALDIRAPLACYMQSQLDTVCSAERITQYSIRDTETIFGVPYVGIMDIYPPARLPTSPAQLDYQSIGLADGSGVIMIVLQELSGSVAPADPGDTTPVHTVRIGSEDTSVNSVINMQPALLFASMLGAHGAPSRLTPSTFELVDSGTGASYSVTEYTYSAVEGGDPNVSNPNHVLHDIVVKSPGNISQPVLNAYTQDGYLVFSVRLHEPPFYISSLSQGQSINVEVTTIINSPECI